MTLKSLVLKMPSGRPFDRDDWFYSFLGHFVLPVTTADRDLLDLFWFGQYEHNPFGRFARFRYRTNRPEDAAKLIEKHRAAHGFTDITAAIGEVNYSAGEFIDVRFFATSARNITADERREHILQLLHAASRLMLHTLSVPDNDGYWQLEANSDQGNNPSGRVFDSVFHLLGNLTNHHPIIVEVAGGLASATQFNILQSRGANLKQGPIYKIQL